MKPPPLKLIAQVGKVWVPAVGMPVEMWVASPNPP